ncbi:DNA polymerase III PolC-type [Mycolicibacterium hassiacum DSM 44199]|nr:DNA polymerase III PolC-type [Mycolicibacterium hassiacum DSM 44199]
MGDSSSPLPPAMETAYRLLTELGPLSAADLREKLRAEGFSQMVERLAQAPDRFPHRFRLTSDGLLAIASHDATGGEENTPPVEREHWYRPTGLPRLQPDEVGVLDIETTGLDRHSDSIWEIALVRLDGEVLLHTLVDLPPGSRHPAPDVTGPTVAIRDALAQLDDCFVGLRLILGHNLLAFDKPFVIAEAQRAGISAPRFPLCADTLHLSLLTDVAIPNRSLDDLCLAYELPREALHRALDDATATAALARTLVQSVDVEDASWQLTMGLLHEQVTVSVTRPDWPVWS